MLVLMPVERRFVNMYIEDMYMVSDTHIWNNSEHVEKRRYFLKKPK